MRAFVSRRLIRRRVGIDEGERGVGHQRADRQEDRAGGRAAGDEIHVARAQRVEHQLAEARPRRDRFDGERPAEQRADDQAVDRRDRAAARSSARRAR